MNAAIIKCFEKLHLRRFISNAAHSSKIAFIYVMFEPDILALPRRHDSWYFT